MKKKFTDSSIIALVAAVIMIVSLFLPYAAARPGFRQLIEMMPADMCIGNTDITMHSTLRVSMVEFLKIYGSSNEGAATEQFCTILVVVMAVTALLVGVFSFLKKPVPMLFCNIAAFAAFYLHNGNYADRGVVPGAEYRFGIGYYLFAVAAIVAIAGGIFMLQDRKAKKKKEE